MRENFPLHTKYSEKLSDILRQARDCRKKRKKKGRETRKKFLMWKQIECPVDKVLAFDLRLSVKLRKCLDLERFLSSEAFK